MANADSADGTPRGVVAVGASAGGVEALTTFAANLATDLPYAILVTLHLPPSGPSVLAKILDPQRPAARNYRDPRCVARGGPNLRRQPGPSSARGRPPRGAVAGADRE